MQKIITISGGLTSAYVAKLVLATDENAERRAARKAA